MYLPPIYINFIFEAIFDKYFIVCFSIIFIFLSLRLS